MTRPLPGKEKGLFLSGATDFGRCIWSDCFLPGEPVGCRLPSASVIWAFLAAAASAAQSLQSCATP